MANRRMFSLDVIDTDTFLDMPCSARLLYYDLGMRADDDGFLQTAQKILRFTGATKDDMNVLVSRGFVIPFDSGVIVIRHWKQNNEIKKDRYKPTVCVTERAQLSVDAAKKYELAQYASSLYLACLQSGDTVEAQNRLGKDSEEKDISCAVADAPPAKRKRFVPPTVDEVRAYCEERRNCIDAQAFIDHYSASHWMRGKTEIKDWKACVRTWEQRRSNSGTRTGGAYSFDDVYERF